MIDAMELFQMIHRTKPFQPLRLYLTGGRTLDIRYPYNNVVGETFLVHGVPTAEDPFIADHKIRLSLTEIDRVERLTEDAPVTTQEGQARAS